MYSWYGTALRIERSQFLQNINSEWRANGALYLDETNDVTISDSTFADNEAVRLACMCSK